VLSAGLFRPVYWLKDSPEIAVNWERYLPEEGTTVNASLADRSLELNISPAISVFAHHEGKRLAASVYFEIAAKYAEKVGGSVFQQATVLGCKAGDRPQALVLARYPDMPIRHDRICQGFQELLARGTLLEPHAAQHGHVHSSLRG
jgi:hypothetical protein